MRNNFHKTYEKLVIDSKEKYSENQIMHTEDTHPDSQNRVQMCRNLCTERENSLRIHDFDKMIHFTEE